MKGSLISFIIKDWVIPTIPREYREEGKQWARVRCCAHPNGGEEFTVEGRFPTISTSYVYTCALIRTDKKLLSYKTNGNIVSYKKKSELVTKEDVKFMLMELPSSPAQSEVFLLCAGLPQPLEKFRLNPLVEKLELDAHCDYMRLDEEDYIRRVYGVSKPKFEAKLSALSITTLREFVGILKKRPWEMCFPRDGIKQLECSRFMFHMFSQKLTGPQPFITATIIFDAIKIARAERGNTVFTKEEILAEYAKHPQYTGLAIEEAFNYLQYRGIESPIEGYYCLERDYDTTKQIVKAFLCLNSDKMPAMRSWTVPCKPKDGLTNTQQAFIQHTQTNSLTLLQGAPGTGKSECLVALMARYANPLVVTFVGQMVDALQVRFGNRVETAHTIHSICHSGNYEWLSQFDIVIVDECANVDEALFSWLMRSVPRFNRLVCVGDMGQIYPIDPGCPFHDLIYCYPQHLFTLDENKRVDPNSRALADASAFIHKGEFAEVPFTEDGPLQIHPNLAQLDSILDSMADIMQFQVVVLRNVDRNMLNRRIEDRLVSSGKLVINRNATVHLPNISLFPGKKIAFTKNVKSQQVRNGELAKIKRVRQIKEGWKLTTTKDKHILISRVVGKGVHPNEITEGYATTCNKAQGSEWDYILFYIYDSPIPFFTREFAYVAVSRAKKQCIVVGNRFDFNQLCVRKATPRKTLLRLCLPELEVIPHEHVKMQDFSLFTELPAHLPAVPILVEKNGVVREGKKKAKH
jgi:hypothetical protein